MAVKIGTKYKCVACQSEFIVIKATPNAELKCCGTSVENK